jgi:hypothetical protein
VWRLQMFCEYEHIVIRWFFVINWFSGFGCPQVVFLFGFKEFPLRNQISVLTALLLYIFDYLFGCNWFGVFITFILIKYEFANSCLTTFFFFFCSSMNFWNVCLNMTFFFSWRTWQGLMFPLCPNCLRTE